MIFIGYAPKGTIRYAGIRGTKEKYRGDAPGSEKAYGFSHTGTDDTLFVFEAPIDLLSFLSATGDGWETHHYISLGGVSEKALMQYLADHKNMTDERIEKAIRQNDVRLMIMDPIQAYLGANVDMNRANEIRPLFRNLSNIAERTGCAIVLIGHLNKASGVQSDYRTLGSVDIAAAVRSILFVEKVEKEKSQDIRVVYQQKDSLAKKENPVAFSLSDEGLIWMGEYDISIDDLLAGNNGTKKETKLEKAKKLILELLGKRKMMCLKELEAELQAYEISARTGRDARKDLEDQLIYGWYQSRKTISLKKDS